MCNALGLGRAQGSWQVLSQDRGVGTRAEGQEGDLGLAQGSAFQRMCQHAGHLPGHHRGLCPTPHKPQRGSLGPALAWPHMGGPTLGVLAGHHLRGLFPAVPLSSPALTQLQPLCALCSGHSFTLIPSTTPCPTSCTLSLLQPPSTPSQNTPEHPSSVLTWEHPTLPPPPAASHPLCSTPSTASGCSVG